MRKIVVLLKIQGDAPKVLCSIFEKPVKIHKDNQGTITLTTAPQIPPHTKKIAINYHHFWIFVSKCDVSIENIHVKGKVSVIL